MLCFSQKTCLIRHEKRSFMNWPAMDSFQTQAIAPPLICSSLFFITGRSRLWDWLANILATYRKSNRMWAPAYDFQQILVKFRCLYKFYDVKVLDCHCSTKFCWWSWLKKHLSAKFHLKCYDFQLLFSRQHQTANGTDLLWAAGLIY